MPVIKASQTRPLIREAIVLDLGDLNRQARQLRQAAKEQAAQILAQAQQQAQQIIDSAHGRGFQEGKDAGYQEGLALGRQEGHAQALEQARQQLEQIQASWVELANQFDQQRQQMERQAQQAVLELSLKLARKLVHRVIEVDPSVVVDQLRQAVAHVLRPTDVKVHVHPADRPLLEEALPQLTATLGQLQHVQLVDDESVGRGGCLLSYGQGQIDATIQTQLQRIIDAILPAAASQEPQVQDQSAPDDQGSQGQSQNESQGGPRDEPQA
ncbi:MAG TPA: FliH/SctL family protein [Phycisphaeraceae bacterium]